MSTQYPDYPEPLARTVRTIHGQPEDETVNVHTWTNDNLDLGYPSESAEWNSTFAAMGDQSAYERALQWCGKSHQGFHCEVEVYLNGVKI